MARIRQRLSYSDTRAELVEHKDARRGAVEDAFWDEDELVDAPPSRERKPRKRNPGCPENNGKSHIYVWEQITHEYHCWYRPGTFTLTMWQHICCGCGKVSRKRRYN